MSILEPPPATTPNMTLITLNEVTARALFARASPSAVGVTALADSGASHILLQESAAHVLQHVEYSRDNDPPFAELKAANHGVLTAIGRGTLLVSNLAVTAYIFSDRDLANNLVGLVPFANLRCTGVFKPRSFQIYKDNERTPILSGTRDDPESLWRVLLSPNSIQDTRRTLFPPPHAPPEPTSKPMP
jgi:hypothetical protein